MTQMSPQSRFKDSAQNSEPEFQGEEQTVFSGEQAAHSAMDVQQKLTVQKIELSQPDIRPENRGLQISLRTKAAALAIALGTLPVLLTGFIAYRAADQSIVATYSETKIARAQGMQDKVIRFMRERYGDIQVLASLPIFTESALSNATSSADKKAVLDNFIKLYKAYENIGIFDLRGDVILQSKGSRLENQSDRDYFQAVLKTNQPMIGNPEASKSSGIFSINFAAPIKDENTGKTIAIVISQMPVDKLNELLANFGDFGDEFHLVDFSRQGGRVFLANDNNKLGQDAKAVFPEFPKLQATGKPGSLVSADKIHQKQDLVAFAPLKELEGLPKLNWGAIIATPLEIAFEPQRQLLLVLSIATGITALLAASIASTIAIRAIRPLLLAAEAVEKIGQGELDTRLDVRGDDEMATLGFNINGMAARLEDALAAQIFEVQQERLLTDAKGSGVLQETDLQAIFDRVVEGARQMLNLDRVVIYRINTGLKAGIVSESVDASWVSALQNNVDDACIPEDLLKQYRQGRVVVTDDVFAADLHPDHLQMLKRLEVKSNLVVPVFGGGQLFGLLIGHSCAARHHWQESEINFLKRLGNELGLSMYRIALLEQTTELAAEQRQLKEDLQRRALELLMEVDPISRGDLTIRAKVTVDEIGTIADSYNATVSSLRKIVLQVQEATHQVTATASTNEASVQALSADALQQAEEISAALEIVKGMANTVQSVAANAEQAEIAVQQAAQTVEEGDAVMNRTVEGIQVIRSTVADTAKKVKHLGESSQKISKVVELISAFAAQTNMLALNASIEASRAGEEGRGFAVVANEVRSLARQSAEATEEIRKLVSNIQAETGEVVIAMESGIEQVVTGTKLVDETRQSLNKITAVSAQISELVEAIAQATVTQSQASEVVTQTMKDVAASASKTSQDASQVSSSFEELRKVAQVLQAGVDQFKVS